MQVQERSLPVSIISVPSRYKAGMCFNPGPKRASRINQEFFLLSSDGVLPSFTPSHSRQPLPLNHSWLRKWNLFNFLPMSVLVASLSCIYIKCSLLFKPEPSHLPPLLCRWRHLLLYRAELLLERWGGAPSSPGQTLSALVIPLPAFSEPWASNLFPLTLL